MPYLNFPSNPLVGDTYSIGTRTWIWNGYGWQIVSSVTSYDPFTSSRVIVTTSTNSTSTNTGGLLVYGGVGVGQDLWVGGKITAQGDIIANGNIVLGNSTGSDTITIAGEIQSDLIPKLNSVFNLGSQTNYWNTIWATQGVFTQLTTTNLIVSGISTLTNTTNASNTYSGALQIVGGVGVGGNLYATNLYSGGSHVVTEASLSSLGVTSLTAGTDTTISTSTGAVTIWNTSTLQSVTSRGATTDRAITITNTSSSISTTTGALQVRGGIGISGSIYVGNKVGFVNASNVSRVYQIYNSVTDSLDTVFE